MAGVILAGGRATRMAGADKPLLPWRGRTILASIVDGLQDQVGRLAISANGEPTRYASWGLPVLPDPLPDFPGPLAGVLAGLLWAARLDPPATLLLSWPGDMPDPPPDLLPRLAAVRGTGVACAADGDLLHPPAALWPIALAPLLADSLARGERSVESAARRAGLTAASWPRGTLRNINTPGDLVVWERSEKSSTSTTPFTSSSIAAGQNRA